MCTAKSESEEKERKIYVFSFFSLFLFLFFFGFCKWKWQCESAKVNTGWPHDVTHRSIGVDMWVRVHSVPFRTLSSDEMTSQSQSQTATIATSTTAPHNHPVNLRCVLRGIKTKAFFTMRNLLLFFRFYSVLFCSPFASVLHFCISTESLIWSDSSFPPFSVCLECVFIVATRSCHRRRPKLNHQPSTSPPHPPPTPPHCPPAFTQQSHGTDRTNRLPQVFGLESVGAAAFSSLACQSTHQSLLWTVWEVPSCPFKSPKASVECNENVRIE